MNKKKRGKWIVNTVLFVICLIWVLPTAGLLVSSFKSAGDINESGWWKIFPHREWITLETVSLPEDTNVDEPIQIGSVILTDEELREGAVQEGGKRLIWGNRLTKEVAIQEEKWVMNLNFTADNYKFVLMGSTYEIVDENGFKKKMQGDHLFRAFLNSIAVTVPSTLIPLTVATFSAYGFAWMRFPGKRMLFFTVVGLLVIPIQVALVPIYKDFMSIGINGSYLSVWLAHTAFGLPLTTYFMHNYISQIPKDIFESAFMDGASHFTIFSRLILPLSIPAIASIGIFQFIWVWNDYLISLVFLGGIPEAKVLTMKLADMIGTRGDQWHLLTSGAFISLILPLTIFFLLQRYFVKGMLGGSVKG